MYPDFVGCVLDCPRLEKLKTMIIQDTDRVLFWLEILAHCLPPEEEEEDMWEAQ